MALNLKNARTLEAIDALAHLTGESKSEAVASAVEARLAELIHAQEGSAARLRRIAELTADTSTRFVRTGLGAGADGTFDDPTTVLYDEAGLPR